MSKPCVFISCGQYTAAERTLGSQIAAMVTKLTGLDAFFAQDVQDLDGLDNNILGALHDSIGFIAVLHPRGDIERPDGPDITRASVWIEQEIAIAAYIHRVEKRPLWPIVFKHKNVGLEGLRSLLHLNPIEFTDDAQILNELPKRLSQWKTQPLTGIKLQLKSSRQAIAGDHPISFFQAQLVNDTNRRIEQYTGEVRVPAGILKHWHSHYPMEVPSNDRGFRTFRFTEEGRSRLEPHTQVIVFGVEYCIKCGADATEGGMIGAAFVSESKIAVTVWIDGQEQTVEKTLKELALDR